LQERKKNGVFLPKSLHQVEYQRNQLRVHELLTDMIADAACKVRTNGKSSSNLRVIIRTQNLPSSCQKEAVRWVLRCLEDRRLEYAKDEFGQYPWNVVSNVVNELDALKYETDDGYEKEVPDYPELVVAIRVGQVRDAYSHHGCDEDQLVVLDENPPCPELEVDADIFKEIVKDVPPPPFITAVGISAVSDEFMMTLWSEIIAGKDSNSLDGNAYMGMWKRFKGVGPHELWGEWNDVVDDSWNFGWKGYDHNP
jgi:hypothetical protein